MPLCGITARHRRFVANRPSGDSSINSNYSCQKRDGINYPGMTRWSVKSKEWRKVRAPPSMSLAVTRQSIANSSIFLMHAILGIDKVVIGRPARGCFFPQQRGTPPYRKQDEAHGVVLLL